MSMTGESDNWRIENYQIEMMSDSFKAGNGVLFMKGTDKYKTNSFSIEVHAVINGKDNVINRNSASAYSGSGMNIAKKQDTGSIEGDSYLGKDGNPIALDDINNVYVIVTWWDKNKEKDTEERIDLYHAAE